MLFVSDYDVIQGVSRISIIAISVVVIIAAIIIGIILTLKSKQAEVQSSKNYLLGSGLFAYSLGFARAILLYHDYFANDSLDEPLWRIANTISIIGLIIFNFTVESYVYTKTKRIITIFGFILLVIFLILPKEPSVLILYPTTIMLTILPMAIYMYMWKVSTGNLRQQAIFIVCGILVILFSNLGISLLYNQGVLDRVNSQLFAFLLSFVSLLILAKGFLQKTE